MCVCSCKLHVAYICADAPGAAYGAGWEIYNIGPRDLKATRQTHFRWFSRLGPGRGRNPTVTNFSQGTWLVWLGKSFETSLPTELCIPDSRLKCPGKHPSPRQPTRSSCRPTASLARTASSPPTVSAAPASHVHARPSRPLTARSRLRAVVKTLVANGHTVRGTVRDLAKSGEHVTSLGAAPIVVADMTDAAALDKAFAGVDGVFHMAAVHPEYGFEATPEGRDGVLKVAVEGTEAVIAAAKRAAVKRVVLTSSLAAVECGNDTITLTESTWSKAEVYDSLEKLQQTQWGTHYTVRLPASRRAAREGTFASGQGLATLAHARARAPFLILWPPLRPSSRRQHPIACGARLACLRSTSSRRWSRSVPRWRSPSARASTCASSCRATSSSARSRPPASTAR